MSARLVYPADALAWVGEQIDRELAKLVLAELRDAPELIACRLRPGTSKAPDARSIPSETWTDWQLAWDRFDLGRVSGVDLVFGQAAGRSRDVPTMLTLDSVDAALDLLEHSGVTSPRDRVTRARGIAARLSEAGSTFTSAALKKVCGGSDRDAEAAISAVRWLHANPDLSAMTMRQLPIPDVDTKWLGTHAAVVRELTSRDVRAETRPRLSVVHLTYLDPAYRATGSRRHDAWTAEDAHELAYQPRVVLVVENRDPRLWFPELEAAVVVEGEGKAVAASLPDIPWIASAERVVYWGDIDVDGFEILDGFRREMRARGVEVESLLMDAVALDEYAALGVNHDKDGNPLDPSKKALAMLTRAERDAYARVATAGKVPFRRIEQERISGADVQRALAALCAAPIPNRSETAPG
ncbi:Wadjet anti-phage system protein JetD domain-containing protein [Microbacterium jejuense]|uniref:Wadjet anti-phage system protein JetD domain-containing protein n=1 Tax=Microbacterium jejuense TaxID=1263637 RepID=UPI0031EA9282